MHYANGRKARLGDLVRGHGYNVKHVVVGKVVNLRPGPSCNISVAHVDFNSRVHLLINAQLDAPNQNDPFTPVKVEADIEHGQTDRFVAIDPATGAVLPPEPPATAAVIPISSGLLLEALAGMQDSAPTGT